MAPSAFWNPREGGVTSQVALYIERNPRSLNSHIRDLLRLTETHNRYADALTKAAGEQFNIFKIMRIGHLEVTTHSPILADLLNPGGTHGQGAVFLRLFLDHCKISNFHCSSAKVKQEYHAGPRTEKAGGRIDILISDRTGPRVVIENKIYAGDGDNQMKRYRATYPKANLLYLTLEGREPSGFSLEEVAEMELKLVSYERDILEWLKVCRKEAAVSPSVREALTQYIHLIQELTNQSTTTRMNDDLIKAIIKEPETFQAFNTLCDAYRAVQEAIIGKLDAGFVEIAISAGLQKYGSMSDLSVSEGGFAFISPELREQNLQIRFEFDNGGYRNLFFGFALLDIERHCPIAEKLVSSFSEQFQLGTRMTAIWPAWGWWHEYRNWSYREFEAIRSGEFANELKVVLKKLAGIADEICQSEKKASKG
jgi:hypothetical protein